MGRISCKAPKLILKCTLKANKAGLSTANVFTKLFCFVKLLQSKNKCPPVDNLDTAARFTAPPQDNHNARCCCVAPRQGPSRLCRVPGVTSPRTIVLVNFYKPEINSEIAKVIDSTMDFIWNVWVEDSTLFSATVSEKSMFATFEEFKSRVVNNQDTLYGHRVFVKRQSADGSGKNKIWCYDPGATD